MYLCITTIENNGNRISREEVGGYLGVLSSLFFTSGKMPSMPSAVLKGETVNTSATSFASDRNKLPNFLQAEMFHLIIFLRFQASRFLTVY